MWRDLQFGWRLLARNKAFTAIAIVTLMLGIGVNTAIFSVVNALLLRPLPYPQPERLVWVEEVIPALTNRVVPGAHFLDWQQRSQSLDGIAAYNSQEITLTGEGEPERLNSCLVSMSFFPLLDGGMLVGRNFLPAEDQAGGEKVVVLSHSLWQQRFRSDTSIIGRSIRLNDTGYRVIGVLAPDFQCFVQSDVWMPLALDYAKEHGPLIRMLSVFARLKPDVTAAQTVTELETIRQAYEGAAQKKSPLFQGRVQLTPLHRQLVGETRRLLLFLLGAVIVVLLIACANVANLQLARAVLRQKELAIRTALGAGRWRVARQLVTENLLLATAGGAGGILLAWGLTKGLVRLSPAGAFGKVAQVSAINIDARVLGFTLLVSVLSGVFFSLAPTFYFARANLNAALKEGGQKSLFFRQRIGPMLLVVELALAVVLLVGAGLLLRSFIRLLNLDPGFQTTNILTARLTFPFPRYEDEARRVQFQQQVLAKIAALPGVEQSGAINHLPLTEFTTRVWLQVEGRPGDRSQGKPPVPKGIVSSDYFHTLGIPLRAGRFFDERDAADAPRVIILNESFARQLFPSENPLGKRLNTDREQEPVWHEIVGIVGDIRQQGLDQEIRPMVYLPYQQNPPRQVMLAIRSSIAPATLTAAMYEAVRAVDPNQPLYEVMTMEERLKDSLAARRLILLLVGVFALLALLLAAIGVYGVVSYIVSQRTHEVGIRMALGAQATDILRVFLRQGMVLVTTGLGLGLLGAYVVMRVMSNLLFEVRTSDPLTFVSVAALLAMTALLACWLPMRRATKVDPLVVLRQD